MVKRLALYQLPPSPNSIKVRVALGVKSLPYDQTVIESTDRSELVRISGQPLAPVLTHGETVIFDSASILRYLDANFRQPNPLFFSEREPMKELEGWEVWARTELAQPIRTTFGELLAGRSGTAANAEASRKLTEMAGRVEDRLADRTWLVGDRITAADITAASTLVPGVWDANKAAEHAVYAYFHANLRLGDGRDRTRAWIERVMAFDR